MKSIIKNVVLFLTLTLAFAGCVKEEVDHRDQDYGYVQFKLYKKASYAPTKAISYLGEVAKVRVTLDYNGQQIAQTLVLSASDSEAAEYGLRSDKFKLLAGTYTVSRYELFDKLDQSIVIHVPSGPMASFTVVPGGLQVHDLTADVTPRGKVSFTLVKNMEDFKNNPMTKAGADEYTFDEIRYVTLSLRESGGQPIVFDKLPAEFSVHFKDDDDKEDGYQTSSIVCDTLLSLLAGSYTIESYATYNSSKILLESSSSAETAFEVTDNAVTKVKVPVRLYESDEYIKDYYALYEIWKSLHGEDWYYVGQSNVEGANWDFNKDPDLWGNQPGVKLHSNGRVALLDLSDFGFYGELSPAIGQLTELVELYLGNHNDFNMIGVKDPIATPGESRRNRMEAHKAFMTHLNPPTQMGEPIARSFAERGISIPEVSMYDSMSESDIIDRATGRMKIQPKDMISGKINNGLTKLPDEIGNLRNLEQLFIANGKLASIPATVKNLESCTDVEIYNCPEMKDFPLEIAQMPNLITLNISNNRQWSADQALAGLKALANGPSKEKIQILYFNDNNLEEIPEDITNMKKLGLLNFSNNNIGEIKSAWGNDIKPVQLYLDNNRLEEFPTDEKGVFCYMEDAETFSVRGNLFTEFPDIFDAGSLYAIVSIDFSYNNISKFQNGEKFKGVYVETLTIANNPEFTKYPIELKTSNSKIMNINFRGCNLSEFPEKCFEYENAVYLQSFDFSYNDLKDLPSSMHAGNLPYLYGVELSYNQFSSFPWEPLDSQYLTVFAIRGQRNDAGERCLSEWPVGLYNHRGLRGFYIGSNNLGKIDDIISTLIYYLDISDNPEIVFDASDICYAHQQGAYYLIYDKTQDIRNCDYMLN